MEETLAKSNTAPVQITSTFIPWINFLAMIVRLFPSSIITLHEFSNGSFLPLGFAEKQCLASGKWFFSNITGEWTNYKTCSRIKAHLTQEHIHVALYGLSAVALTPAIIIFFAYK